MTCFYNREDLYSLRTKAKICKFLYIFILILFIISETLLIVFADYYKKGWFMAGVASVAILSTFLFIYFFDRRRYLIILYSEFATILNSKPNEKEIKILKNNGKITTLSDSSCVYEIIYEENGSEHVIYLSNIFDNIFEVGRKYKILENNGYIEGYEDED